MLKDRLPRGTDGASPPGGTRRSLLGGLLGGALAALLLPRAATAQTAGAACAAGEVGTLRRGTGADANRLLFCTDANLGSGGGTGAAAWINFNGASSPTVRGSFNVSSVTKSAVGDYISSFAVALADANYAVSGSGSTNAVTNGFLLGPGNTGRTTASVRALCFTGSATMDPEAMNVVVHR